VAVLDKIGTDAMQLEHGVLELVNLARHSLVLVRDQLPIEVHREDDKDDDRRDDDRRRHDRRDEADAAEADPGEHGHLREEEQDADAGGEDPRQLDVPAQRAVRRTAERRRARLAVAVVLVAGDGVDVRQNARADEQCDEVDCDDERRTDRKHHQQRDGHVFLQVDLNHRYLQHGKPLLTD